MPRTKVRLEHAVERLSILDDQGKLDDDLEPDIEPDCLRRMHRTMLLARLFDERQLTLQRQGRIGTFAPVKGQEACQVGAMAALRDDDWFVPAFREFAAMLWRGFTPADIIVYDAGYNEGGAIAEGRHDMPISIPVATQVPHAAGLAYASRYRGNDDVAIAFFGDGATSEGDFYEALNFAGVFELPVIFLCQNNQWAISLPRDEQSHSRTLAQKGVAAGIHSLQVDGNDVLAVYAAVAEAAQRARDGDGPTMIECVTYRLSVHTTADDPDKYRDEKEVERWEKRDPIPRFQKYLKRRKLLTKKDIETLEDEIEQEVDQAWKDAEARMKKLADPSIIFDHLYDTPPPYLKAQREAFARHHGRKE